MNYKEIMPLFYNNKAVRLYNNKWIILHKDKPISSEYDNLDYFEMNNVHNLIIFKQNNKTGILKIYPRSVIEVFPAQSNIDNIDILDDIALIIKNNIIILYDIINNKQYTLLNNTSIINPGIHFINNSILKYHNYYHLQCGSYKIIYNVSQQSFEPKSTLIKYFFEI